ncbi:spermine transporter [Starmerella bacillaris]|uniref:Spermine transporter n=1 Tax=Starmerella bacillaris TaxID=1247836 RepID=A0AAV5RP25_STABA|nr:spermine transporter [Starmerella bacillaris]
MGIFGKKEDNNMSSLPSSQEDGKEETVPLNEYVVVPGRPFPETPGPREDYLVTFAEDDPERPINWSMTRRVIAKGIASICITFVSWGSSVIAPASPQIKERFHIGNVPAALCVSLYVVGFAVGPMIWGPGSELYGRKLMLVTGMCGFTMFAFACATAENFQTLVICRFFMGTFGCTTLVVGPSISADLFTVTQRGKAVSAVIFCLVCGPMVAPVVGAFITNSYLHWRWTQYITGIMGGLGIILMTFVYEETYPQIVLRGKAVKIRKETGNWAVSAPIESMELDTQEILHRTLLKPLRMMFVEPILLLISVYQGFVYAILYLCLEALPFIFEHYYHWDKSFPYLPYLGMLTGSIIVIVINLLFFDPLTASLIEKSGMDIYPESRLPLMMMCGIVFPIGIFLMCWSGAYHVQWIVPTIGAALLGFGLIGIFLSCLTYIIDCYLLVAASAIAANTFIRSSMAGAFPLFALAMFRNLGAQWAGTLLGCLAVLLAPAPYVFFFYGPTIRKKSKYAKGEDSIDREDLSLQVTADPATRRSMPDYEW